MIVGDCGRCGSGLSQRVHDTPLAGDDHDTLQAGKLLVRLRSIFLRGIQPWNRVSTVCLPSCYGPYVCIRFSRRLGLVPSCVDLFLGSTSSESQASPCGRSSVRLRAPSVLAVGECLDIGRPIPIRVSSLSQVDKQSCMCRHMQTRPVAHTDGHMGC